MCEHPESLLLVEVLEDGTDNEVHALAVADRGIPLDKSAQYISQWDNELFDMRLRLARVCAPQVKLYLAEAWVRVLKILIAQYIVIVLVLRHAHRVGGTRSKQPQLCHLLRREAFLGQHESPNHIASIARHY